MYWTLPTNQQSWIGIRSSHHVWFIQLLFLRKQGLNLWKNDESWYSSPKIDSIWDADRKLGWSDVKTWFSQEKDREKGDFFRQTLRIRRPWRFWNPGGSCARYRDFMVTWSRAGWLHGGCEGQKTGEEKRFLCSQGNIWSYGGFLKWRCTQIIHW